METARGGIAYKMALQATIRTSVLVLVVSAMAVAGCTVPAPVTPSIGAWRLSGTVASTAGVPITGARLTVQEGANKNARVASDASGRFLFERLESGRFKIIIDAPGFVSVTPVVELLLGCRRQFRA